MDADGKNLIAVAILVVFSIASARPEAASSPVVSAPMSFSNRLLLNRAVVYGQERIEIMVLVKAESMNRVRGVVMALGGHVQYEIPAIDYLRVNLPVSSFASLVEKSDIAGYQISSNANMLWDQEGVSEQIAKMYREYEGKPIVGEPSKIDSVLQFQQRNADLPVLTVPQSRGDGYTAEDDTGVRLWLRAHPKWDGRGVTIAVLESGLAEFDHPTLRAAEDLQGRPTPKIELADTLQNFDPASDDVTRVSMSTVIQSPTVWFPVAGRTYILPRAGTFRFGKYLVPVGGNLEQEFAVLWDTQSGEIFVDTDGDADFRNEKPLRDFNEHFDVGKLQFTHPGKYTVSFVVARARDSNSLQIYSARVGHQAMTASVAAGSRTTDGLASGVAPNSRVLIVRNQDEHGRASDFIEGYADIARRPEVDVLSDSRIIAPMPDTNDGFYSMAFQRLATVYHKPIFHSGGNGFPGVGFASALDGIFSVGGSISPVTYAALYGGGRIERIMKHPLTLEGPGGDGGFKPDFLAPVNRIAADKCSTMGIIFVPKNAPKAKLPPCYQISGGTSASSPYAAGIAALLISASRQNGKDIDADDLGQALRASARYLPESPAYAQGAGVLDVNAAWKELQRKTSEARIHVSGPVVHPMTRYAPHPGEGVGLFEVDGWIPGQSGQRILRLRREAGVNQVISYRVSWTGNDGTFTSPGSVRLPLNESVQFPVRIHVKSYGPHSAILDLRDPATGAIVSRSMATIVAPQPIQEAGTAVVSLSGSVPLMESRNHYVQVAPGVAALRADLEVRRGSLSVWTKNLDPTGSVPNRPVNPSWTALPVGKYTWVVAQPAAGTWALSLTNDTSWREPDPAKVYTGEASYSLSLSILNGNIGATSDGQRISIQAQNQGAELGAPVVDAYPAILASQAATFLESGMPNIFPIDVPEGSGILRLSAKATAYSSDLEVYLYDCTSGQCFYWDYAGTAARAQTLTVHSPKSGKWVVAINAAPVVVGKGGFVLEEIVGGAADRYPLTANAPWQTTIESPPAAHTGNAEQPPADPRILYFELVDAKLQEAESQRIAALVAKDTPAERKGPANPVAIASAIYELH